MPFDQVLSGEAMVMSLALLSKPLACYAEMLDGLLCITALRREATAIDLDHRRLQGIPSGDFLCVGRDDDWLLVPQDDLHAWHSEFRVLYDYGIWREVAEVTLSPNALAAAKSNGIGAVVEFTPMSRPADLVGEVFTTRLSGGASSCERCHERVAHFLMEWFEAEHSPRALCQRCIDIELTTDEFNRTRSHGRDAARLLETEQTSTPEQLRKLAHEEARRWAFVRRPPYIREFIQRHRGY